MDRGRTRDATLTNAWEINIWVSAEAAGRSLQADGTIFHTTAVFYLSGHLSSVLFGCILSFKALYVLRHEKQLSQSS